MTAVQIARLVEDAGGEYRGIQVGTARIPSLVFFNDPETRTTLALPLGEVTAQRVREEILKSREPWR